MIQNRQYQPDTHSLTKKKADYNITYTTSVSTGYFVRQNAGDIFRIIEMLKCSPITASFF